MNRPPEFSSAPPPRPYHWLRSIGLGWCLSLEPLGSLLILIGAIALLVGGLHFHLGPFFLGGFVGVIVLGHLLKVNFVKIIYRRVKCPYCGHNPMMPKHGRRGDLGTALRRLRRISKCPECHKSPDDEDGDDDDDAVMVIVDEEDNR